MPSRPVRALVTAGALIAPVLLAAAPAVATPGPAPAAQQNCPAPVQLTNTAFEEKAITGAYAQVPQEQVTGWSTTAADGLIELWRPPVKGINNGREIDPVEGKQFAELNATQPSMLYQDLPTVPGQVMVWSIHHRARDNGPGVQSDTMHVMVGKPGAETAQTPRGAAGPDITDTEEAWGAWTGTYVVPAGQTTTRFGFKAVSTGSGDKSVGNFLDDIKFGNQPCVSLDKAVSQGTAKPGDELTYTLTARNTGGSETYDTAVSDRIPADTAYVPGSLTLNGAKLTDTADADAGEVADGRVVVRPGGIKHTDGTAEVKFRVTVDQKAVGTKIRNQGDVTYAWPDAGHPFKVESPEVVTQVNAPLTPLVPAKEVTPLTPLTPAEKVTPLTPLTPAEKVKPTTPAEPVEPVKPVEPSTPAPAPAPSDGSLAATGASGTARMISVGATLLVLGGVGIAVTGAKRRRSGL